MESLFGTTGINFNIWMRILLIVSSVLFLAEMEKYFVRREKAVKLWDKYKVIVSKRG